jgi:hypothetical protein
VSNVVIFIEGGGTFEKEKRILRAGFDSFFQPLKRLAAERGKSFRLVACGGRDEAFRAFENERKFEEETHCLLLIDSEEVLDDGVKAQLAQRERHWNLTTVPEGDLHVMTTTMETWIIADLNALRTFYGQHFAQNRLPVHNNLEKVSKQDVWRDLAAATQNSQAGIYHKMRHAPKLLSRMDSTTVRQRCSHCNRLFQTVETILQQ